MKVKEFVALLNTLDQDKQIKIIVATGYEYEEETSTKIVVGKYKELPHTASGVPVFDYDFKDAEKDFYLLAGEVE